jgi:hypothetical protein
MTDTARIRILSKRVIDQLNDFIREGRTAAQEEARAHEALDALAVIVGQLIINTHGREDLSGADETVERFRSLILDNIAALINRFDLGRDR